jgi:hypothetical protein
MRILAIAIFGLVMLAGSSAFAACDYHTAKADGVVASDQKAPSTKLPPAPSQGS